MMINLLIAAHCFNFARPLYEEKLRQNRHGFQVNTEGPQNFAKREF